MPVGTITAERFPFAVLWHEAIRGRNQEDIISTFKSFFLSITNMFNILYCVRQFVQAKMNIGLCFHFLFI